MNPLMFLPVITGIIEKILPGNVEKQQEAKAQLVQAIANDPGQWEAQSKIITAEATGESSAQRNWRPHLMYLFMIIIASNYILVPILHAFGVVVTPLPIPEHMWYLIEIGVGGYIIGRSGEKIAQTRASNNFPIQEIVTQVISAITKKK